MTSDGKYKRPALSSLPSILNDLHTNIWIINTACSLWDFKSANISFYVFSSPFNCARNGLVTALNLLSARLGLPFRIHFHTIWVRKVAIFQTPEMWMTMREWRFFKAEKKSRLLQTRATILHLSALTKASLPFSNGLKQWKTCGTASSRGLMWRDSLGVKLATHSSHHASQSQHWRLNQFIHRPQEDTDQLFLCGKIQKSLLEDYSISPVLQLKRCTCKEPSIFINGIIFLNAPVLVSNHSKWLLKKTRWHHKS